MSDLVTLTIDGVEVTVPKGTVVVDAAKQVGIDIPVFCYHPKMKPVGMCRMCLVEVGTPVRDRATGEIVKDSDGNPQIRFFPTLQTGCTVEVSQGMVVRGMVDRVKEARDDIVEFLLTSHPLDCPVCDKGGECPLQNLTMRFGPDRSRFAFEDKLHFDKHVPLGELIFLDRERCIQCARCTRFQSEIVDDPVIGFHNRGRKLQIITFSDPGFDSYWSGNTTDVCPVGALTTADFRFGARPWELTPVASLCPHCPVGCNTTMSTRQEARSQGRTVIKRILPRQNEEVNEIWICDKGRFAHHFADAPQRLQNPLIRKDGKLVETTWDKALDMVAGRLQLDKDTIAGLAGDRLSNEDLYLFQKLFRDGLGSNNIDLINRRVGGADVVAKVGLASGSNLKDLGDGDAILVVATDLHEEAPIWWLRVKQAAERGVALVVINGRKTRLDKHAALVSHYKPGQALESIHQLLNAAKVDARKSNGHPLQNAADLLIEARNLVVFYGAEGLSYEESDTLAKLLGNLLLVKPGDGQGDDHAGRVNNGLIAVWPHGNSQGAMDMGLRPDSGPGYASLADPGMDASAILSGLNTGDIKGLFIIGADPVGDGLLEDRSQLDFMIVQELFLTETAAQADIVLPAQSWAEREGSYTSGERRVQRFYTAINQVGDSRPDWLILAQIGERIGLGKPPFAASLVFREISEKVPQYANLDYRKLAWTEEQWPLVGGDDLYYGGTSYRNESGLGKQWPVTAESSMVDQFDIPEFHKEKAKGLIGMSMASLYSPGTLISKSEVLAPRLSKPAAFLNVHDAEKLSVNDGDVISVSVDGYSKTVQAVVDGEIPQGLAILRGIKNERALAPIKIDKVQE